MKKLLASIGLVIAVTVGLVGVAGASTYSNIYCYPTGTYWQKQFSNPNNTAYYAAHNAAFLVKYGPGSKSCE